MIVHLRLNRYAVLAEDCFSFPLPPFNSLRSLRPLRLKIAEGNISDQRERILANARQRGLGAAPRRRRKIRLIRKIRVRTDLRTIWERRLHFNSACNHPKQRQDAGWLSRLWFPGGNRPCFW